MIYIIITHSPVAIIREQTEANEPHPVLCKASTLVAKISHDVM